MVPREDRRVEPRMLRHAFVVLPYTGREVAPSRAGNLIDFSPHGVCVELDERLEPDTTFLVKLKMDRLALVGYTVRFCVPSPSGGFRVGAELKGVIDAPTSVPVTPDAIYAALFRFTESP